MEEARACRDGDPARRQQPRSEPASRHAQEPDEDGGAQDEQEGCGDTHRGRRERGTQLQRDHAR
jgi:hypothetical protein